MSFFAVQDRLTHPSKAHINKVGPGTYNHECSVDKQLSQAYAPFGSTASKKKLPNFKTKAQQKLGPGQYDIMGELVKPSITKYENKNCIIVKINEEGWSQFKSKSNRFKTPSNVQSDSPGPGYYVPERQRPKSQPRIKSQSHIGQKINEINRQAYLQRNRPTLFSDNEQNNLTTTKSKQEEARKKKEQSKVKGQSWSLNKKERFSPLIKQAFTEQYRQQLVEKLKDERKSKSKKGKTQSAVFASKSLKSQLQGEIYQTSNPFKVELRKMINFKDEKPGPGTYYTGMQTISDKLGRVNRYQFFGSTADRFNRVSHSVDDYVGPGHYSPEKSFKNSTKAQRKLTHNFKRVKTEEKQETSKQPFRKCSYIDDKNLIPGPGHYCVESINTQHKKAQKTCTFASTKPRFEELQLEQTYEEDLTQLELNKKNIRQRQLEYRKKQQQLHKSAIFTSTTDRFNHNKKIPPEQKIPIGHYQVTSNDIGQKLKKNSQKDTKIRRKKKHTQEHPFMSSVGRFCQTKDSSDDYNKTHLNCWCLIKSIQKQVIPHESPVFAHKDDRFKSYYHEQNGRHLSSTPAVGVYSKETSFIKDSFNSRFVKKNQSKTKKIKTWNAKAHKLNAERQDNQNLAIVNNKQMQLSSASLNIKHSPKPKSISIINPSENHNNQIIEKSLSINIVPQKFQKY